MATLLAVAGVGALDAVLQLPTVGVSVALLVGTCAAPHLRRLGELLPRHAKPRELARACPAR